MDVTVKYYDKRAIVGLTADSKVRQAGDAELLLGHVDQRLDRVRYHRRRRIEVLAPAAQRPSLKLAAGRVAAPQTGMGLEVDYILGR
jgi:hypothetical protein